MGPKAQLTNQVSSVKTTMQRKFKRSLFRNKRRAVRYGLISINILLVIALSGFIISTRSQESSVTPVLSNSARVPVSDPLDTISSADIAVNIAQLVRLDQTTAVINHADSRNATLEIPASDTQVVTKPQIVKTDQKSKQDIVRYTVAEGDTLAAIAERFGVTSDSVRWSNGLTSSNVAAGLELLIPPVEGIVYKVKSGETAESLASRFRSDEAKIVAFNDAELTGLVEGDTIVIPDGQIVQAPRYNAIYAAGSYAARYGGNGYDYGWCTWHAANRRLANGQAMPSNLGNAITWYALAQRSGLPVGNEPRAGAIVWHANLGGLGHVAYVESINEDGSALVSDMNYPIWGTVTYRTVTPSEFGNYRFIY
jgi:surface antigen